MTIGLRSSYRLRGGGISRQNMNLLEVHMPQEVRILLVETIHDPPARVLAKFSLPRRQKDLTEKSKRMSCYAVAFRSLKR